MSRYEYSEIEEANIRLTEIDVILGNNLFEDENEERVLMNEKKVLEEFLLDVIS